MHLAWRPMALVDREVIMNYLAQHDPVAAIKLDDAFEAKAEQARQRPTLYRTGRVPGTREIVVHPNYLMVYRVESARNTVTVLRVLHPAQQ